MSRSYRKIPKYSRNDVWAKRQASKKARKSDLLNGGQYKKVYCSWNICDYPGILLTDDDIKYVYDWGGYSQVVRGYTK
jgi:hypothetical protein